MKPEQPGPEAAHSFSQPPLESELAAEARELPSLEELPGRLGYTESAGMTAARQAWTEALRADTEDARDRAAEYQDLAETADAERLDAFKQARQAVTTAIEHGPAEVEAALAAAKDAGFVETGEMRLVRVRLMLAIAHDSADEATTQPYYTRLANELESAHGAAFQLGLMLTKAMAWHDAGKTEFFEEDLDDALAYAQGMAASPGPFKEVIKVILGPDENS
jgi:hypothetical protein